MTKNSFIVSGMQITGVERNISLSLMNAPSCSFFQLKEASFLVKLWRGQVRAEKFRMNFWQNVQNPMNDQTTFTDVDGSQLHMALSFVGSMYTSLFLTMRPRYSMLHLAQIGTSIDSKASWRATGSCSEKSNTKRHCRLGGSGSSERRSQLVYQVSLAQGIQGRYLGLYIVQGGTMSQQG